MALTRLHLRSLLLPCMPRLAAARAGPWARLLLTELNGVALHEEASDPATRDTAARLLNWISMGGLAVRMSPLAGWAPDFSVFRRGPDSVSVLLGSYAGDDASKLTGPLWGIHLGPTEARLASNRFERLWKTGHDVGPGLVKLLGGGGRVLGPSGARRHRRSNPVDTLPILG